MVIGIQWSIKLNFKGNKEEAYKDVDQIKLYKDTIAYAQSKGVDIVTPSEAFEIFGNAVQCGDYLGYWNTEGYAVNKLGQYDYADNKKVQW